MSPLQFSTGPPLGYRATLGLIVLQADETIEYEFNHLLNQEGIALYVTRVSSSNFLNPESLMAMESKLPDALSVLPNQLDFDVIGYGCTSGAALIGTEQIHGLVKSAINVKHVTDPMSAVIAASRFLGARRLGFVTPYIREVSTNIRQRLQESGLEITSFGSFEQEEEHIVAAIDQQSIIEAALLVGKDKACDAVFLACTNLRTIEVISRIEELLDKPVISSNQALAWHMLRCAGSGQTKSNFGVLLKSSGS